MKFGILFPGYGSQFVGMGKELYDNERVVQEYFEEAATCLNINFVKLCFASSEIELAKASHAYTALFLMGASCAALLKERSIHPSIVAGVDVVSWYSALFAAGSVNFPDGLYILNKIGTVYQEIIDQQKFSGLLIKGGTKKKIADLCLNVSTQEEIVSVAQITSEGIVVVGNTAAIDRLENELQTTSCTYEATDIEGGLYTSSAEGVALQVNSYLEKIDFKDPLVPVVSPIDGKLIKKSRDIKHIASIVFVQQLDQLAVFKKFNTYDGVCIAIPSTQLQQTIKKAAPQAVIDTMETAEELKTLLDRYQAVENKEKHDSES